MTEEKPKEDVESLAKRVEKLGETQKSIEFEKAVVEAGDIVYLRGQPIPKSEYDALVKIYVAAKPELKDTIKGKIDDSRVVVLRHYDESEIVDRFFKGNIENGHVTSLELNVINLKMLPDEMGQFPELRHLDISLSHQLAYLTEAIKGLKKLDFLKAEHCSIVAMPDALSQLTAMERLLLNYNHLRTVPNLSRLKRLKHLYLEGNDLYDIPGLGGLVSLETLNLAKNKIHSSFDLRGLGNLSNLRYLNLSSNGLTSLPEELSQIPQLRKLHIQGNELHKLPEFLLGLAGLRTFEADPPKNRKDRKIYAAVQKMIKENRKKDYYAPP